MTSNLLLPPTRRRYSPKAEAQAFASENGYITPGATGADQEFSKVHSELMNAATPAVEVLGIANVIECELEINPEYNSFCFKLDGGVEFNVVPNIINEECITAKGSAELPRKCMVSELQSASLPPPRFPLLMFNWRGPSPLPPPLAFWC